MFFEIKLVDWIVRHDIQGDGLLVKTLHQRGRGFDRPGKDDFLECNVKIYQREAVFFEQQNMKGKVSDESVFPMTVRAILESMKRGEKITCLVQPAYFIHLDTALRTRFPDIDEDKLLQIDIELLHLRPITDIYADQSSYWQTLQAGDTGNTASPFNDCKVLLHIKLEIDGQCKFDNFNSEPLLYDLEEYQMPAVLRRVVKITKLQDVVEIRSSCRNKLLDHLDDPHGVFKLAELEKFEKEVVITFKLLEIEQKMHLFKVPIQEKLERLQFFAKVAQQFRNREAKTAYFKNNNRKKALKIFVRINRYFRNKDARNNFLEEETDTLDFRNASDEIDLIHLENFKNYALQLQEDNNISEALALINEALNKIDHKDFGCNVIKAAILKTMHEYAKAGEVLNDLLEWHPDRKTEIEAEIAVLEEKRKGDEHSEEMLYRNMFEKNDEKKGPQQVVQGVGITVENLKKPK